jgi:hypothetical protein
MGLFMSQQVPPPHSGFCSRCGTAILPEDGIIPILSVIPVRSAIPHPVELSTEAEEVSRN